MILQVRTEYSYSFRVPERCWTIINLFLQVLHGSAWMGLHRKLHGLLFGCGVLCMVVFACAVDVAAQSRSSKSPSSRGEAREGQPGERADVARFRQRVDAAISASRADKGFSRLLITDPRKG